MPAVTLSELPDGFTRATLVEAARRRKNILNGKDLDATGTLVIGLADIITEMQREKTP